MAQVKVTAIEPVNGKQIGEQFEVSEREAAQLIQKGLAKMLPGVQNKMAAPAQNKANPSPAAGEDRPSSASQAARASRQTTVKKSGAGAKRGARKKPGE